jgi:hypothetical protein
MILPGRGVGKGVRGSVMRSTYAIELTAVLLLAACGTAQRPPPPYFEIPPGPAATHQDTAPPDTGMASSDGRLTESPNPSVQYFLPSHPGDVGRAPEPVPRPTAATQPLYPAAPNLGPVTGYGPGGIAQPPGALPNPPYSH